MIFLLICSSVCWMLVCPPVHSRINKFSFLNSLEFQLKWRTQLFYVKNNKLFLSYSFFCYILCHNTILWFKKDTYEYYLIDKDILFHWVLVLFILSLFVCQLLSSLLFFCFFKRYFNYFIVYKKYFVTLDSKLHAFSSHFLLLIVRLTNIYFQTEKVTSVNSQHQYSMLN